MIKKISLYFRKIFSASIMDDKSRQILLFNGLNILLSIVSLFMTIVNIFTHETVLMLVTLAFSILCVLNLILAKTKIIPRIIHILFILEFNVLLSFFVITGHPEGFSALWVSMVPCFAMLIFGKKEGSVYCLFPFLMLIFFFWTPIGQNFLMFEYTKTFMLRFPFFYTAIYIISLFLEIIRSLTQDEFKNSENKYKHLYRHDALTSLNNRYGFYEEIQNVIKNDSIGRCSVIMADIDHFKRINDDYGHQSGDRVLKGVADIISETVCGSAIVSRWGGEEFLIFLKCDEDPMQTCETIREKIANTVFYSDDREFHATISMGICVSNIISKDNIDKLIRSADDELYNAKNNGRNLVVLTHYKE